MKKQYAIRLNPETHKRLKIRCIGEGVSVSEKVERLIKKYLKGGLK